MQVIGYMQKNHLNCWNASIPSLSSKKTVKNWCSGFISMWWNFLYILLLSEKTSFSISVHHILFGNFAERFVASLLSSCRKPSRKSWKFIIYCCWRTRLWDMQFSISWVLRRNKRWQHKTCQIFHGIFFLEAKFF